MLTLSFVATPPSEREYNLICTLCNEGVFGISQKVTSSGQFQINSSGKTYVIRKLNSDLTYTFEQSGLFQIFAKIGADFELVGYRKAEIGNFNDFFVRRQ